MKFINGGFNLNSRKNILYIKPNNLYIKPRISVKRSFINLNKFTYLQISNTKNEVFH